MFFGRARYLRRSLLPVAITGGFISSDNRRWKTVMAKDPVMANPVIDPVINPVVTKDSCMKVYGFTGSPDTHSLLIYLKWKGIPYQFQNINPFDMKILEELPCGESSKRHTFIY